MNPHIAITQIHPSITSLAQFPGLGISLFWGLGSAGVLVLHGGDLVSTQSPGQAPWFQAVAPASGQFFHLWQESSFLVPALCREPCPAPALYRSEISTPFSYVILIFPETPAKANPELFREACAGHRWQFPLNTNSNPTWIEHTRKPTFVWGVSLPRKWEDQLLKNNRTPEETLH